MPKPKNSPNMAKSIEWVVGHLHEAKDEARPPTTSAKNLWAWVHLDPKNKDWLIKNAVQKSFKEEAEKEEEIEEKEPATELVHNLLNEWIAMRP